MTPEHVYKYCNSLGTDILLKLRLKITPPNRFNDPFEFAPRMEPSVARKEALRLIKNKQSQRKIFEKMIANGQFSGSYKQFKKLTLLNREKMVQGVLGGYSEVAADPRRDFIDLASKDHGLLCLSAVGDNILMWSHYGQSHSGLVIGFDGQHALFSSNESKLVEVEYREERVEMGYIATAHSRKLEEQVKAVIRRKSLEWSYEREWRQLRFLRQCITEQDASSSGQSIISFQLNRN
jgi:hypothetical protein